MGLLQLAELPEAIPIPYRSARKRRMGWISSACSSLTSYAPAGRGPWGKIPAAPLDREDLLASGVFGVGMVVVQSMLRQASRPRLKRANHGMPGPYLGH